MTTLTGVAVLPEALPVVEVDTDAPVLPLEVETGFCAEFWASTKAMGRVAAPSPTQVLTQKAREMTRLITVFKRWSGLR